MESNHQHIFLHAAPAGVMSRSLQIFLKAELGEVEIHQSYSYMEMMSKLTQTVPQVLIIDVDLTGINVMDNRLLSDLVKTIRDITEDLILIFLVNNIAQKNAVNAFGEKHAFLKGVQDEQLLGVCAMVHSDKEVVERGKIYRPFRYDLNSL